MLNTLNLSSREADTAIIGLNGKAPLHWIVKYTNTSLRSENDEKIQLIDQLNEAFTISLRQKQELEAELKGKINSQITYFVQSTYFVQYLLCIIR